MPNFISARRLQLVLLSFAGLLTFLAIVPSADAALRSPRLATQCATGYTYGEVVNGPWRVEGCHKAGTPKSGEDKRTRFNGTVEVNGLLIEGAQEIFSTRKRPRFNAARSTITDSERTTYRIFSKGNAQIKVDYPSGNRRIKDQLFSGKVDLKFFTSESVTSKKKFSFDIPVGSNAKIMGMRVRESIEDAKTNRGTTNAAQDPDVRVGPVTEVNFARTEDNPINSEIKTVTEFKPVLSMGSQASSLLRNWTAKPTFKLIDGKGLVVEQSDGGSKPRFKINEIVIPGIGGFTDFNVTYDPASNTWTGTVKLDLGDLFPRLDFAVTIDGNTGVPTRIETTVSNLAIPIGSTGVTLREVSGFFQPNPLVFGAGAGATFGPRVGGFYVAEMSGNVEIQLEPNFRLEVGGSVRVLPTSNTNELGRGTARMVLDSSGFFSVSADARFQIDVAGIGARANVAGSGAFSTSQAKFNIQASLSGQILLGFLGEFEVARIEALVSSKGWGACASVGRFISGGVGQEWGRGIDLFLSCDLSPYRVNLGAAAAVAGEKTFTVGRDVSKLNLEITGDGGEPRAAIINPAGEVVARTFPLGRREIGANYSVIAEPGQKQQIVGIRNPRAGVWKVRWGDESPNVASLRIATDVSPITAEVNVGKQSGNGARRIAISKLRNLDEGETVELGVKTPVGIQPLGDATARGINQSFTDTAAGNREIVAIVSRNGIPNPARTRVLGRFESKVPGGASKLTAKRRKSTLTLSTKMRKGALAPTGWVFVLRSKGRPIAIKRVRGRKAGKLKIPSGAKILTVAAYPVVAGKVLKVRPKTVRIR